MKIIATALLIYFGMYAFVSIALCYTLNILESIIAYLLIHAFTVVTFERKKAQREGTETRSDMNRPLNEVTTLGYIFLNFSSFASILNPFQLFQLLLQLFGQLRLTCACASPKPEDYTQAINYGLPFRDEFFIVNGGVTKETSHSWNIITQRYAYDFVIVGANGKTYRGKGRQKEDYFCYGKEIISVADGEVVKCLDGVRDAPFVGTYIVDFLASNFIGNHVIIQHSAYEFSLYAHLIPGSLEVSEGQKIKRGGLIGLCGNSGHSTEPHLHFHFQNKKNFYFAYGLPIKFSDMRINGKNIEGSHFISTGEAVRPKY